MLGFAQDSRATDPNCATKERKGYVLCSFVWVEGGWALPQWLSLRICASCLPRTHPHPGPSSQLSPGEAAAHGPVFVSLTIAMLAPS